MFIRHRPYSKPSKCFFPPMKALSSRKVKNLSLSSDRIFPIRDRILNLPNAPFHKDAPMRCVTESRQSFSTLLIKRKKQLSAVEKIIKTKIDWPATLRNSKHSAWFISFTKARHQNPPRDRRDAICFISSLKTCQNLTWKHLSRHGDKCFFCWRKENCFFSIVFFLHSPSQRRVTKTPQEIDVMRYVAEVSSKAHCEVMKHIRPGMREYQLESVFQHHSYYAGGCR